MKLCSIVTYMMCLMNASFGGVPSAPPNNVHVHFVGLSSITVKWEHVPSGSRNGFLIGYRVRYQQTFNNGTDGEIKTLFRFSFFGTKVTLAELEKASVYIIEVAGVTSSGTGPYSEPFTAQTYDPCASGPCLNGGTCVTDQSSEINSNLFHCVCAVNFPGKFCSSDLKSDLPCHSPNVSLPNLSPEVISASHIHRSSRFIIQSDVSLDCELSQRTTFRWNVYQLNAEELTPVLTRNSSLELHITPRLLPIGVYMVQLTVNMLETPVFGVGQGYFKMTTSPLVAIIAGGSKVARGFNKTLVFNASMSYDPDKENQHFNLLTLNFTWRCRQESGQGGCYKTGDAQVESSEPLLRLNSGLMMENSSYLVTVFVKKDVREAEYTQQVFIVPGDPPEVQISCLDNCGVKMNPSGRIALQGICVGLSCGGSLNYKWSLFQDTSNTSDKSQWVEVSEIQQLIRTRLSSTTLVTYPRILAPDVRYKFVLSAQRQGGYPGYSEYQVTTNSPPVNGTCDVSPVSGVTLTTEFTFMCTDWQDPDLPLQYEYIYFTNNDLLNVVYQGVQRNKKMDLPAGEKENNFTIDFRVRVVDMFGEFTEVTIPVQVMEPRLEAANLVDVVLNLTTGDGSKLTSLIQSGDLSSAIQFATAAIAAVDAAAQSGTENQDDQTEKRIAVKYSIVQQLSAVQVETVVRVQQVSKVIAQATSIISEVPVEAQKLATDALQKMTAVFKRESAAGESYETLFDGAKSLLTGLASILRVSSYEARVYDSEALHESHTGDSIMAAPNSQNLRKHQTERKYGKIKASLLSYLSAKKMKRNADYGKSDAQLQAKNQVGRIFYSLEEVGSTILSRTLVGEAPIEFSTQSTSLLVFREDPGFLAGSVFSSKGSSFTLPSIPNLFSSGAQFFDSQMTTINFIPFTWDSSGAQVTTGVASLELKNSTGHVLNMTELKSPIYIKLPNTRYLTNNYPSYYVKANRSVFHKINVTQSGMALLLKVRPENNGTELLVSVKYGERPSLSNSDLNMTIPDFSSCESISSGFVNCSRDPYVVLVNNVIFGKIGCYFIGITAKTKISGISRVKRCSGHGRSKRSCIQYKEPPTAGATYHEPQYLTGDENYTIQAIPAACLYWNTEASKWTPEGCEVAETTTQESTHCYCNHLSSFGGQLFVAPNPIDFDQVFIELTRLTETGNVAVIVAVSCLFGLYLLLLLWARNVDKHDLLKVGERTFLGVHLVSSHVYEIQISTGIWRNSGTTAKVFIMLEGELGSSRPYHLKNDLCTVFARGSKISFVISTPVNIGPVRSVRVWHDNSGSNPSWFLNYIQVFNVMTHEHWKFPCYVWLAVDKGDGLVHRSFSYSPTAKKRIDFTVFVQNRIAEEFSDEHLWFSVATRPPRYRFTRVQRLSCCLSLMLTTMLASAMFYEFDSGADSTEGFLKLGRFVINLQELIIGLESHLIIIPVNLLIVGMFTYTRSPMEKKRIRNTLVKKKRQFSFPHWFIFVPWLLCILLSVCAAAFVVMYSLQWGVDTSESWLISVGMSLFMDIFVSEPLKIIVVAFMLSHMCPARPADQSSQTKYIADTVTDVDDIKLSGIDKEEEDVDIPKPPSKRKLRHARATRMRERYMYAAFRKIVSYIVYLWILMVVCYGERSEHGYLVTSSMKKTFGELGNISNHTNTWDWVRDILVPGLYDDGKDLSSVSAGPYVGDGDAVLVGMPRLRQLRVRKDCCYVVDEVRGLFNSCVASYTHSNEDKTTYQPKWRPLSSSGNMSVATLDQICPSAWRYSSPAQTQSLPFRSYGPGGYLAELGYDKNTALKVISQLRLFNWIDKFTSAVIVEFAVFNPHVGLFSTTWLPIEFLPSGHVASNHVIRTMHVYDVGGGYDAVTLLCQVLLVTFIIYFVVVQTKKMVQNIRFHFSRLINWLELAQTLTVIVFIVTRIIKETELIANTAKLSKNVFQMLTFDRSVFLYDMESLLLSLLIFFNTFKLLYLLKFNHHVQYSFHVMKRSALELIHCSLVFAVFILTCVHVGYLVFGGHLYRYSSPFKAVQSLLVQGVLNDGEIDQFLDCCATVGPVYILALNLGVNLVCINLFMAVLIRNYGIVKRLSKGKFSFGRFMIIKMKEILGCIGDQPKPRRKKKKRTKRRIPKIEVPDTKITDDTPELVDDLARQTRGIIQRLNELYADDFGEDSDLFFLWLELYTEVKEPPEDAGYCALA